MAVADKSLAADARGVALAASATAAAARAAGSAAALALELESWIIASSRVPARTSATAWWRIVWEWEPRCELDGDDEGRLGGSSEPLVPWRGRGG